MTVTALQDMPVRSDLAAAIDAFIALGTPGVRTPSAVDLMTANMGRLDDEVLLAVATAMRDEARGFYELYARWVRVIRARWALTRKSERAAAKGSGVSRAAIRKATTAAKKK